MSIDTRSRLLEAACRLVLEEGVSHLTLEAVAQRAGVSKGGLLYHFSSKDRLVHGMLEYALLKFEQGIDACLESEHGPGAWLRGYIRTTFAEPDSEAALFSAIGGALLATIGTDPRLVDPYCEHERRWRESSHQDGLDAARADLIRAAVDGAWLKQVLGLARPAAGERDALCRQLLEMTRPS